jgi:hypothetical protein
MADVIYGAEVLAEAAGFLNGMSVSHQRAGYAEGEEVVVFVSPHFDEEGAFSLHITCQARGGQRVDWGHVAVRARHTDVESARLLPTVRRLDARGQTWVSDLVPGTYHVWSATCVQVEELPPAAELLHAAAGEEGVLPFRPIPVYLSLDGSLTATVRRRFGEIEVAFETANSDLAGRVVEFAFVLDNQVWSQGILEVELETTHSGTGPCRAVWTGPAPPPEWNTLLFTLLPQIPKKRD